MFHILRDSLTFWNKCLFPLLASVTLEDWYHSTICSFNMKTSQKMVSVAYYKKWRHSETASLALSKNKFISEL